MSNALKFTQKGDSILVNVEQLTALTVAERYQIEGDDDFVLITVYDNGVAIAPEDLKNIFDPFISLIIMKHQFMVPESG